MSENIVINEISVQAVKGVKSISFSPAMTNIIGGDNGQGKSSLIDAIIMTIKNREMGNIVEKVIHEGEDSAETEISLSNGLTISSKWTKAETGNISREFKVYDKDGKSIARPQEYVDSITNGFGFDPTKFFSMTREEQYKAIIALTDLDISSLNKKQDEFKLNRRDIDREIKRLQGIVDQYVFEEPVIKQDVSGLTEELRKAQEHNLEVENVERNISSMSQSVDIERNNIANSKNQIQLLQNQIATLENNIKLSEAKIQNTELAIQQKRAEKGNIQKIDISEITRRMNQMQEHNQNAVLYGEVVEHKARIKELEEESETLNKELYKLTKLKIDAINSLNLVDGLSVDEEKRIVMINNIPLKDLSSAEQMHLAVKLAMKTTPNVKVLLLQNASLLDKKTRKEIINICNIEGWQVFFETVGIGDVIIKEGMLLDYTEKQKYIKEYMEE